MQKAVGKFRYPTFEKEGRLYNDNGLQVLYLCASARPISGSHGHKGAYAVYGGRCGSVNFGDSIGRDASVTHIS